MSHEFVHWSALGLAAFYINFFPQGHKIIACSGFMNFIHQSTDRYRPPSSRIAIDPVPDFLFARSNPSRVVSLVVLLLVRETYHLRLCITEDMFDCADV
mmetsp:Transcript_30334/g.49014  ORF Transcript_30334/g.49014 Transcript_30334/m.49014 type:complete len:99 (-) Transcript_30334:239-535(-)